MLNCDGTVWNGTQRKEQMDRQRFLGKYNFSCSQTSIKFKENLIRFLVCVSNQELQVSLVTVSTYLLRLKSSDQATVRITVCTSHYLVNFLSEHYFVQSYRMENDQLVIKKLWHIYVLLHILLLLLKCLSNNWHPVWFLRRKPNPELYLGKNKLLYYMDGIP